MGDKEFNKIGTGGYSSISMINLERRDRLRKIAAETTDLMKDPYFYRNHMGIYECKLCLTIHNNEGSYLAHTQSKKHQTNLNKRKVIEAKHNLLIQEIKNEQKEKMENLKIKYIKIGRPAYRIMKEKDFMSHKRKIKFEIDYPLIKENISPQFRIMSELEVNTQKNGNNENDDINNNINEEEKNKIENKYHYVVFAAEPYENIAVRIPNMPLDYNTEKHFSYWDEGKKIFYLTLNYK
jgi:splicing factor 3A subunit 2